MMEYSCRRSRGDEKRCLKCAHVSLWCGHAKLTFLRPFVRAYFAFISVVILPRTMIIVSTSNCLRKCHEKGPCSLAFFNCSCLWSSIIFWNASSFHAMNYLLMRAWFIPWTNNLFQGMMAHCVIYWCISWTSDKVHEINHFVSAAAL